MIATPCTTCGGMISAQNGGTREADEHAIFVAVREHRQTERHRFGRTGQVWERSRRELTGFYPCACPVELASGLGCLVETPGGRLCHSCRREHALVA
jgi:hypothetical protein